MSYLDTGDFREHATLLASSPTSIYPDHRYSREHLINGASFSASQEQSTPLSYIPQERNAEPFPLILALQQHPLPAREFRPLARVLLALHGRKARPQEHGMLAILGI